MTPLVLLHESSAAQRKAYLVSHLIEAAVCVVPASVLLFVQRPLASAEYLYGCLGMFLLFHAIQRDAGRFTGLLLSVIPIVMFLRTQYVYSGLAITLFVALALWAIFKTKDFLLLAQSPLRLSLLAMCFLYWLLSFAETGYYSTNLHAVELAETASCVFLLGRHRWILTTALIGMGMTTALLAVASWGFGERLGMMVVDSLTFGNPIIMGLPAALVMILGMADNARWLGLQEHRSIRFAVIGTAAIFLMATTSRGSWLVAAVGLLIALMLSKRDRWTVIGGAVVVLPIAIGLAMVSSRGDAVLTFFDRATNAQRTAAQLTTGRAPMWAALPSVVAAEPVLGYGPGMGVAVMHNFLDRDKLWHALYLQIIVETGLPGTLYLLILISVLLLRAIQHYQVAGEVVPLMGILCYLAIGLSISAIDAMSGVFLGLALLGGEFRGLGRLREFTLAPRDYMQSAYFGASAANGTH